MYKIEEYLTFSKEERQKHIDLNEECIYRGGDSIQFRGLLAFYLNTEIPNGHIALCCHACHNGDCSNPKHLYWGTPKENVEDKKNSPEYEYYIERMKESLKGENSNFFGVPPWRNINGPYESWKKAGNIYNELVVNNWDFSVYGQGPSYLEKNYNLGRGTAKKIIKMFDSGWNPWEDKDWLEYFNYTEGE